jgi:hypothetical protein
MLSCRTTAHARDAFNLTAQKRSNWLAHFDDRVVRIQAATESETTQYREE